MPVRTVTEHGTEEKRSVAFALEFIDAWAKELADEITREVAVG